MRTKSLFIAVLLLTASPLAVQAGTTPDDAAKLKTVLQGYFGSGTDAVTIKPEGDGYNVSFDLSGFAKAMQAEGAEVKLTSFNFILTPTGSGKWKVQHKGPMGLTFKSKDTAEISENYESLDVDGEYDEAIGSFTTLTSSAKNATGKEVLTDAKGLKINADFKFDSLETSLTGAAAAAGGVDVKFNYKMGVLELTEDIAGPDQQPLHLKFNIADGTADGTGTGLKTLAILQAIKFMNAHASKEAIDKDQAAFKTLLSGLMPVFSSLSMQGALGKTNTQTPLGEFSADKVGFGLAMNGAVKDGKVAENISVDGLVMPPNLVPSWASSLVTKNASLGFLVSGFDLETVAKAAIAGADFSKEPPISDAVSNTFAALLLPKGSVKVILSNTAINNDSYKISVDGTVDVGPTAQPTGKAHIAAKGLDDIMKAIQAAPPEAGLQGGAAVVVVAKGMGKAESDGSLSWDVEATPDGKITVNGIDVSQMAK